MAAKIKRTPSSASSTPKSKSKSKLKVKDVTPDVVPVVKGSDITLDFKAMGLLNSEILESLEKQQRDSKVDAAPAPKPSSDVLKVTPTSRTRGDVRPTGFSDIGAFAIAADLTVERELRASRARRLGEWICSTAKTGQFGTYLYGEDPFSELSEVHGEYLRRISAFPKWLARLMKDERGLQWITLGQDLLDAGLERGGFFDPDQPVARYYLSSEFEKVTCDALFEATSNLYGELNVLQTGFDEEKGAFVEIDVAGMVAMLQTLTAYALASCGCNQDLLAMCKSLDKALVEHKRGLLSTEEKLDSAERKVSQLKSSLDNRPTRGELDRANARIAELEQQISDLHAQQSTQEREAAIHESNMVQVARQQARQEVAGQIDALVRSQADTEKRALAAEASLERTRKDLENAERLRSEDERIYAAEVASLKKAMADISAAVPDQSAAPVGSLLVADLVSLPSDPVSVLELAADVFDGRIAVADSAYDSASDYNGDAGEVWRALRALATVGYDLYFGDGSFDTRIEFENRTGFGLAPNESMDCLSKEERREREVIYNGRKYDVAAHVKGSGRKSSNCLRVHFAVDRDDSVIVVGYCGEHLKSRGTKRKGW